MKTSFYTIRSVVFAAVLMVVCYQPVFAQQEPPDTLKQVVLAEVIVLDEKGTSGLGFYKSDRQNGIENIVDRMAGVNLIRRGNYAADLMYRGMRNEQVGITIDGMQVFGACTDRMDPTTSYVETNNLKSVSMTGAEENSGCHSANIAGGVDLKMKESLFGEGLKGSLGSGYSLNGKGFNTLANLSYATGKLAVGANAVYRKSSNYTNGLGEEVMYSQFEKMNVATNIRYRLAQNQVIRFDFILDDAYNIGYAAMPMDVAFAKARIYGLGYQWFTKGVIKELKAKVYYNFIDHAMDDSQRPDVPIRMDMPGQSKTWGAFSEMHFNHTGKHEWFMKAEAFSNFRHAEMTMYPPNTSEPPMYMLTWPDVRKTSALVYVKDNIRLSEKLLITLSARLQNDWNDVVSDEGKNFMGAFGYENASSFLLPAADAGVEYTFGNGRSLSAHAAYATRGPSTSEQYAFYLFNAYDGYDYIGNVEIASEKALKADLGYKINTKRWQWQAVAYAYFFSDYILGITDASLDPMTIGANGVRVYQNIAHARLFGADLSVQSELFRHFTLMGQLGYSYGTMNSNEYIPLIPPLNGLLTFKYVMKTWEFMLENEFASAQYKVNQNYGDRQTPGFLVNNIRVYKRWAVKQQTLSLECGVDNLFDVAYRNHLDWGGILRIGRNIYAQVAYSF